MTLTERLRQDMRAALKSGPEAKLKLSTLRLLLSEIKNAEIAKRKELADEEVHEVISREIKRRNEAAEMYDQGDRPELAEKEKAEAQILGVYLPEQLPEAELAQIVAQVIEETGASGPGDIGKVMGALMPLVKGRADGRRVNELVREALG